MAGRPTHARFASSQPARLRGRWGAPGNAVLSRVLGMLLAAYSVQFVINGIAAVRASLS